MRRLFEIFLDSQGDLQNIGGLSYLVEVINSVPTSANAEYYAKIVAEKSCPYVV